MMTNIEAQLSTLDKTSMAFSTGKILPAAPMYACIDEPPVIIRLPRIWQSAVNRHIHSTWLADLVLELWERPASPEVRVVRARAVGRGCRRHRRSVFSSFRTSGIYRPRSSPCGRMRGNLEPKIASSDKFTSQKKLGRMRTVIKVKELTPRHRENQNKHGDCEERL